MRWLQQVPVPSRSLRLLSPVCGDAEFERLQREGQALRARLKSRAIWNVNSTARGGGVSEMLRAFLPYVRGAGLDCKWCVVSGSESFFRLTKRLHNALHGDPSAEATFSDADRQEYEQTCRANADELLQLVLPGDVVILHDPQTVGLAPSLVAYGALVVWRCHVAIDLHAPGSRAALAFLTRYIDHAHSAVFSRHQYVPPELSVPTRLISPGIDPLSAKNQPLDPKTVRSILVLSGLIEGPPSESAPTFTREDGTTSRVCHAADIIRLGRGCCEGTRCVVQVSRWDRLKDHMGVMQGFAHYIAQGGTARLILAGPNVHAVADDPEGSVIFNEVLSAYRALPHEIRGCVELVNLPMADTEENAAIVNALQRQAAVVVQKSLKEGFGLTVTEAMWKGKPVIASRVGGIQDQIEHQVSGVLLDDPRDLPAFARALDSVLRNPSYAERLEQQAHQRVQERYLAPRTLSAFAALLMDLADNAAATGFAQGRFVQGQL